MTRRVDARFAQDWGDAHECDKDGKPQRDSPVAGTAASSNMDLWNNGLGRNLGLQPKSAGELLGHV